MSPRKQSANDSKTHDTKQERKSGSEKLSESPRRVAKRSTKDTSVSLTKSRRDSSVDLMKVGSPRRSEKQSSRSSSGGRQGGRKLVQRSATDLTQSTQHIDSNSQHCDTKVS